MRCKALIIATMILVMPLVWSCSSDEDKKTAHLDKGIAFIEKKEYKSAIIELKNALQIDPKFTQAYVQLAQAHMQLNDPQEAFKAYSRVEVLAPDNLDAKIKLATFYILGKHNDEARKRVDEVLAKEPDNAEALSLLGSLLELEKDLEQAEKIYRKVAALQPEKASAFHALARVLAGQNKMVETEEVLQKAASIDPKDIRSQMALFSFYVRTGEKEKAEKQIQQSISAHPDNLELKIVRGNYYTGMKQLEKAEQAYQQAIETAPQDTRPLLVLGDFYKLTGKINETMEMYQKALQLEPQNMDISAHIARFDLQRRELESAELRVDEILITRPKHSAARLLKAELLVMKKGFKDALNILLELQKEEPDNARVFYFKALAQLGVRDTAGTKASLAKAIELNPRYSKAKLLLAEIYYREKEFTLAAAQADEVLKYAPRSYPASLIAGNSAMGQGKLDDARKHYRRMIDLAPKNPSGHYRMGLLSRAEKKNDQAESSFKKALALNPRLMDVFTNLAALYTSQQKGTQALSLCDHQLDVVQDSKRASAIVHQLKGSILMAMQKLTPAETSFKAAMAADPDYMPPYYSMARLYSGTKRIDQAISQYQTLLAQNPNQPGAHMLLGTLLDSQQKFDQSEAQYRKALALNPDFIAAANNLAYLLASQDRNLDEAFELARSAKDKAPKDPNIADTMGFVYLKKELYDSARLEFQESLEKLPEHPTIRYHYALTLKALGERDKAREELKAALENPAFPEADAARKVLKELKW